MGATLACPTQVVLLELSGELLPALLLLICGDPCPEVPWGLGQMKRGKA